MRGIYLESRFCKKQSRADGGLWGDWV